MRFTRLVLALVAAFSFVAFGSDLDAAKGSKGSSHSTKASAPKSTSTKSRERGTPKSTSTSKPKASKSSRKAPVAVARNEKGRIKRSEAERHAFEVQTGYPHGRPGYVIDHIKPLACGGADDPSNMQWQTIEAAKMKDRLERAGC
jgi:hypothetical protein